MLLLDSLGRVVRVPTNAVPSGLQPSSDVRLERQIPNPTAGASVPPEILQRERANTNGFQFFPASSPPLMPYLAGQDDYGNTAIRAGALFNFVPLDVPVQGGKYWLSQYGFRYSLQGSAGYGTIFKVNTDGTDFTNLHNFTDLNGMVIQGSDEGVGPVLEIQTNSDGALPESTLTLFENTLYGTTVYGGAAGKGTTFALSLGSIPLKIQTSVSNLVLTWGNPAFSLQSAPTATGSYTNVSSAASPYTNNITGSQMFFRLQSD